MQTTWVKDYEISIQEAPDYHWYSYDSKNYDKVFHLTSAEDFTRTILLTIKRAHQEKKVVLVVPYYTIVFSERFVPLKCLSNFSFSIMAKDLLSPDIIQSCVKSA